MHGNESFLYIFIRETKLLALTKSKFIMQRRSSLWLELFNPIS